jgi:hypothetical protein
LTLTPTHTNSFPSHTLSTPLSTATLPEFWWILKGRLRGLREEDFENERKGVRRRTGGTCSKEYAGVKEVRYHMGVGCRALTKLMACPNRLAKGGSSDRDKQRRNDLHPIPLHTKALTPHSISPLAQASERHFNVLQELNLAPFISPRRRESMGFMAVLSTSKVIFQRFYGIIGRGVFLSFRSEFAIFLNSRLKK